METKDIGTKDIGTKDIGTGDMAYLPKSFVVKRVSLTNLLLAFVAIVLGSSMAAAQPNAFIPNGGNNGGNFFPGSNGPNQGQANNGQANGQGPFQGGAQNADFDSLIDLVTSTVNPDSWVDNGGTADIRPFPNGVWVDSAGLLQEFKAEPKMLTASLEVPTLPETIEPGDVRHAARMRCVSLPRLEAAIYQRMQQGQPLDESMLVLAGLQRVEYVYIHPDLGDVILAGPAGDWTLSDQNRLVSTDTHMPVVRLDDLLTLLRREREQQHKPFGCSITPRQENLASTQAFLDRTGKRPLPPGKRARDRWLGELRETLGRQDIEVFGIDPGTHVAHVLVKADHHMKQVGIGLDEAVPGVESYLDTVARNADTQPAMNVLRWWFSTNYAGVARNAENTAIELSGPGVCVLSENELLTKRGERIHTGQSDDATQEFAHQFTAEYATLAAKYPVYGELRNVFDLAIVAALLDGEDLYQLANWQPVLFLNAELLPLPKYNPPKEVDSLLNHRLVDDTKILAAVSGGVWFDSQGVLRSEVSPSEKLDYYHRQKPAHVEPGTWWWDLE
ncbi:DUF1598 domain-containing protein [Aeoliella mucimassa]|uniref:Uncharacterized protein n=1 Tax=Aeoliella mucimassa TaxID=2527972 RepID=A0A518AT46_9BACT|nr:DUF1598 domain-containing protein [Aeoliella mucimassa]QDU57888.1 hypothetical protein Pan181_41110 [Aeoliella mucimassa]